MNRRLSELEKDALTQVDGQTTLRIEGAGNGIETPVPSVRLSQLQRDAFTLVDGQVAVRVTGTTSGGGGSCTVESGVSITANNWKNGSTLLGSSISFSQANTGFQTKYKAGSGNIVALCGNTLVTPIPTESGAMGDLSLVTVTLDGIDITSETTATLESDGTLTLDYNTRIVNPDLIGNNNFSITANLLLGETIVPPLTSIITYLGPNPSISISRAALLFDVTYTTATISRTDGAGSATSIDETIFGGVAQTSGATSITFAALNRGADTASRTVTEKRTYTNASPADPMVPETLQIEVSAVLSPTFQFPVYLGSIASTAGITTSVINGFQKSGLFTSKPSDQIFVWNNPMDDTLDFKVFAIRSSFEGGSIEVRAVDDMGMISPVASVIPLFQTTAVGDISTETENYSIYVVAEGQPGGVSYFVDLP